jgi:hypothetical protein
MEKRRQSAGEIRRSQLLTTYGVGSLIPIGDESFLVAGIDSWPSKKKHAIDEPRLASQMDVSGFRVPPSDNLGHDVPVTRFPKWYYCSVCERLAPYETLASSLEGPTCVDCGGRLVPSRFIVACKNGHLSDFPYAYWLHGKKDKTLLGHEMYLSTRGESGELEDIEIRCHSCGSPGRPLTKSLGGAFGKKLSRIVGGCEGTRPWLGVGVPNVPCSESLEAMPRGASYAWFPVVESAISIPPWSDAIDIKVEPTLRWGGLMNIAKDWTRDRWMEWVLEERVAEEIGESSDAVVDACMRRVAFGKSAPVVSSDDIRGDEYRALFAGTEGTHEGAQFVCLPVKPEEGTLLSRITRRVMVVDRLREVRALSGFSRIEPATSARARSAARKNMYSSDPRWMPAIEVFGEGVFIDLDFRLLSDWIADVPEVKPRVAGISERACAESDEVEEVTPQLMVVHAFAHALINQWALDSGYPASSLRERLYVTDDHAAVLIYTASGDSAGSLGGLVALAEPKRLDASIRSAIESSSWCSSDPVCIETSTSGWRGLNRAACHACLLVPETACEHANTLLDRAMLVGTPDMSELGFFSWLEN